MKKPILVLLLFVALVGLTNKTFAQGGSTAVPFLLLAPDSRAGGIGESGAGLADNSAAIFWNPAGIAFLEGSEISFTHSNWLPQFGLDDLFYEYLTYRQYVEEIDGSITASITYMNFGEFIRTNSQGNELGTFKSFDAALTLGYATKLSNDWGFGVNFRVIHSRLSDKPTELETGKGVATSVSIDLATMWRPEELDIPYIGDLGNRISIGLNLSNIGPEIYYIDQAQKDPIPTTFRLGFAIRVFEDEYNSLTYTLDFAKQLVGKIKNLAEVSDTSNDAVAQRDGWLKSLATSWGDQSFSEELRDIITSMGLEYWYGVPEDFMFALRGGFFYEDPSYGNRKFMTMGAGIRYDIYGFDFSYITTDVFGDSDKHPLSDTLRFTLLIGWGAKPQNVQGFPRGI